MSRATFLAVALPLVFALACGGDAPPPPVLVPTPIPGAPAATAPTAVAPNAEANDDAAADAMNDAMAAASATVGRFTFDENNVIARDQIVAAYLDSCSTVIPSRATEYAEGSVGDVGNECLFVEFGQNCNPDMYGCYDTEMKCQGACGAPCDECERSCAPACDSCKAACNGDATCLRTCAEQRADCRDTCMAQRQTCFEACGTASMECDRVEGEKMAAKCGDCEAFTSCRNTASDAGDYEAAQCKSLLPAPECEMYCAWR